MTSRTKRWLLVGLTAVAAIFVAVGVLLASLDLEALARANLGRVQAATGRALTIDGPLSVTLWPRPSIVAERVALANAPFGSAPQMATAQRVEAALEFWPLLSGRIEIARLALQDPQILLETDAKGRGNWEFTPAVMAPSKDAAPTSRTGQLDISSLQIDNGRVTWRPAGKTATAVEIRRLALDRAGPNSARLDAEALVRAVPVTIAGTIGSVAQLVAKQTDWPLDLRLSLAGAEATVAGKLDPSATPPGFIGKLDAKASDLQALSKLADTQIALPTPIALAAQIEAAQRNVRLEPMSLQLGKSTINGSLAVQTGGVRPFVTAKLAADEIDLERAGGPPSGASASSSGGGSARLFSDEKLPFDALRVLDGQIALNAAKLRTAGGTALSAVRLQASIKDGRLLAEPLDFSVAGGKVSVRGDVRAAAGSPRTQLAVNAKAVDLGAILADAGHRVLSGGPTDLQADVSMAGDSLRDMAATISGPVRISMGPGRVTAQRGDTILAILEALRPGSGGDSLQLACAVAVLPFNAGVAVVDRTIAFESPQLNMVASGSVNLKQETLDLALRPSSPQGDASSVMRLAQLVRVHGPLTSPKVGIDAARVAEEALAAALRRGLRSTDAGAAQPLDPQPCRTALTGKPAALQKAPASPAQQLDLENTLKRLFRR